MNILLINHYAGSMEHGMEYRPYYLAKEWVKAGHRVTVLASSFSHLRIKQVEVKKDLDIIDIEGIQYLFLKTNSYKSSGMLRIFNILCFVIKSYLYQKKISKLSNPDVVITSSTYPLDIYPAKKIAHKNKAKLIYELHDLWPLSPMLIGGYSKNHPFIKMMQIAENYTCKNVDGCISLLHNAEKHLIEHGLKKDSFVCIPNGYNQELWEQNIEIIPIQHKKAIEKLKKENKFLIGYAGGHSLSNALNTFIDVALRTQEKDIHFVFVGNGPEKDKLMERAENSNNILFLPSINKEAIPDLLSYMDVLYAGGISSILHFYGTAFNKITDYMLAAKPIIFAVDEPNSIIERTLSGIQIKAENASELEHAIKIMYQMSPKQRIQMGQSGKAYAEKELNYRTLAEKFIEAIDAF